MLIQHLDNVPQEHRKDYLQYLCDLISFKCLPETEQVCPLVALAVRLFSFALCITVGEFVVSHDSEGPHQERSQ